MCYTRLYTNSVPVLGTILFVISGYTGHMTQRNLTPIKSTDVSLEEAAKLPPRLNPDGKRICGRPECMKLLHCKNLCQPHYRTAVRLQKYGGRRASGPLSDPTKWRSRANPDNPDRKKDYEANKRGNLRSNYGITLEDYNDMLERQESLCKICQSDFSEFDKSPHVDHDHSTGKVRAILCHHCNLLLGHAKDNPAILQAAIDYLAAHGITAAAA